MQKRKLTRKCSYLNVASGTSLWARYQEASLDVEELVLQLLSSPGCQQDHCLNLSLCIYPHHLHHHLIGLQLVTTCAPPAMVSVPFSTPPSLCQFCVSFRYFHFFVKNTIRDGGSTALYTRLFQFFFWISASMFGRRVRLGKTRLKNCKTSDGWQ